jgi:hypothetical protein
MVIRRDISEHEATCQHRIESCGMCGSLQKVDELAQHQLVCLKRQVDCDNHGCGARVAFDELAAHKASNCGYEEVGCPFADMGCTARMLRKDIDSHEDAAWKQHNRLLLGKVKEQQRITMQQQQITLHVRKDRDGQQKAFDELKEELEGVKEVHEQLKEAHDGLQREHEELKVARGRLEPQVRYEDITLCVKQAVLTGTEPFAALDPHIAARVYSEEKVVQGRKVFLYVELQNPLTQNCYCVFLLVKNGPARIKVTYTYIAELVRHDGNPLSAVRNEDDHTFTDFDESCCVNVIPRYRLASSDNNPYVKDGYVTFKCTVKIVDEWVRNA